MHWDRNFSFGMVVLGIAVVVCSALDWPLPAVCAGVIALAGVGWAAGGLTSLYRSVPHHTIADRITVLRLGFGAGVVFLFVIAGMTGGVQASDFGFRVVAFLLLAVALLTDFLDGRVARLAQTSRFGEEWDMQNDAAFTMLLSILAVMFVGVGSWVIFIGLARYLFVLVIPGSHDTVSTPRAYALFGKTVCALTAVTLAAVVAGGWANTAATVALAIALFATLGSFVSSIYLLRKERATAYVAAASHAPERVTTSVE